MTTIGINPDCPAGIHLLADHLDTALAVGEDLLALVLPPRADLDEADPETAPEAIDQFVRRLRELEAALLMRVLQARRRATEIGRADSSLRGAANLFRAQTAVLVELIEIVDRRAPGGLCGSNDGLSYLRSRGLLAPEAAAPSPYESLAATEDLRIGGVAALGTTLDLVSSLLDLLDARFGLYGVLPDDVLAGSTSGEGEGAADAMAADEASADATSSGDLAPPPDGEPGPAQVPASGVASDLSAASAGSVSNPLTDLAASRSSVALPSEFEQPA